MGTLSSLKRSAAGLRRSPQQNGPLCMGSRASSVPALLRTAIRISSVSLCCFVSLCLTNPCQVQDVCQLPEIMTWLLLSTFFHGIACVWSGAVYSVLHICSASVASCSHNLSCGSHPYLGAVFSAACPWGCKSCELWKTQSRALDLLSVQEGSASNKPEAIFAFRSCWKTLPRATTLHVPSGACDTTARSR